MGAIIFISLFMSLSVLRADKLLADGDTGYHITVGDYILKSKSIPHHDIFSFLTPPPRWIAHEWLSEVIMTFVHSWMGITGVVLFFALIISTAYFLLFTMLKHDYGLPIAGLVTLLLIASSALHWLARPHIFTILILTVWYYVLNLYQYKDRFFLYLLPLIMLVWVNLHGGYILGLFLLAIYTGGNGIRYFILRDHSSLIKARTLGVILIACLLATLINPNGYKILLFPFETYSQKFIINHIGEFRSPNFHALTEMPFELYLLALIFVLSISKFKLDLIEIALILFFTHLAFYSVRNIPLFAIIAAPILARQIKFLSWGQDLKIVQVARQKLSEIEIMDSALNGHFWSVLIVLLVFTAATKGYINHDFDNKAAPLKAIEFMKRNHISGNMYNEYEFGDFVIYSLHDKYKVFIDGRADMYGSNHMKDYYQVKSLEAGWEEILDRYKINWIFFNTDSPLSVILQEKKDWRLIYTDSVASIFLKNIAENQYLISQFAEILLAEPDKTKDQ